MAKSKIVKAEMDYYKTWVMVGIGISMAGLVGFFSTRNNGIAILTLLIAIITFYANKQYEQKHQEYKACNKKTDRLVANRRL